MKESEWAQYVESPAHDDESGPRLNKSQEQADLSKSHGEIVENQDKSFEEGLENIEIKEKNKTKKKKRAKKARSCAAAYRDALILAVTPAGRKMKGRQSSKLRLEEQNPLFLASQQKQIAGELVDDSDIRNSSNGSKRGFRYLEFC
ncbi:hypothetical protein SLA2020_049060 [Shorea laevis]